MKHTITLILTAFSAFYCESSGSAQELHARVELTQSGTNFSYTVYNDEQGGNLYVSNWHLEVNSPFAVLSAPPGWNYETDNSTYVYWFSSDVDEPYPHDLAPGTSLGGFAIGAVVTTAEELSFAAFSWEHGLANAGVSVLGPARSPSVVSFVARLVDVSYSPERFEFTVQGVPTLEYAVEESANLKDWIPVKTSVSPFRFDCVPQGGAEQRFFRATYVGEFGRPSDLAE